jgi:hypothetical protein
LTQVKAGPAGLADDAGMLIVDPTAALPQPPRPTPRVVAGPPQSTVFLPKEHGSWSMAIEPLALGLLVAPTPAGTALATAALAGFFARRPLKLALAPEYTARRQVARETMVMFSAFAMAGLFETLVLGGVTALWPLLLAVPLGGLFAWFDLQNDSRAAAAELAGSAAFALLPATLATLAGWPWPAAFALSALALARSVPTVLTVRTGLRLGKNQPVNVAAPLAVGVLAVGVIGTLAWRHLVPLVAVVLVVLLLIRTVFFVSPLRPVWPARRLGMLEAALGVVYVGLLGLAFHLP